MARGDLNASQLSSAQRGTSASDRDVELIVMRVLTKKLGLDERMVQDLQALIGLRGEPGSTQRPRAAVRRSDLQAINDIPQLRSKDVGATPTAAEFNALRLDLRRIAEALSIIAQAIK